MIEKNGIIYYDTSEACDFLGVSRDALNRYVNRGLVNRYKMGLARTSYYRRDELEEFRSFLYDMRKDTVSGDEP